MTPSSIDWQNEIWNRLVEIARKLEVPDRLPLRLKNDGKLGHNYRSVFVRPKTSVFGPNHRGAEATAVLAEAIAAAARRFK
jgi:hypothetical protein